MQQTPSTTGYLWHELYQWHDPGRVGDSTSFFQPVEHPEKPETKRRLHNLVVASGLIDHLTILKPRPATAAELTWCAYCADTYIRHRVLLDFHLTVLLHSVNSCCTGCVSHSVHTERYVAEVQQKSADKSKGTHCVGDVATFAPGGYDIACLSAGGAVVALDQVLQGTCKNAYCLLRPPGHHAERDEGMGFCIFNNVAIAARLAVHHYGLQRVAVVDYDVHHGNGTQHIFEEDPRVLLISIHQDNNYPPNSGAITENGKGEGQAYTINIPLPPGSGSGAYRSCFERVVTPALDAYCPELLLVSSGFDASFRDPLAAMILSSEDFRWMMRQLKEAAERHCGGRLVAVHEGGYSSTYVPFCGLAVIEELSGVKTPVADPFLAEVTSWGYQELQPHQDNVIRQAEHLVQQLRHQCNKNS